MTPPADLGLLLLHAQPLDARMWAGQMHILPGATSAPDLYCCGDTLQHWAEHCLQHLSAKRVVLVGCSVGGSCALDILNLAPDRVAATVLLGTKARHDPDPARADAARHLLETGGMQAAWKHIWAPLFLPSDGAAHRSAQAIAEDQSPQDVICGLTAFHTRTSREDVVATSQTPIHIVSGDQDTLPGLAYARHLTTLNHGCSLHVIPNCGHYGPMTHPDAVTALIADVVRGVSKS